MWEKEIFLQAEQLSFRGNREFIKVISRSPQKTGGLYVSDDIGDRGKIVLTLNKKKKKEQPTHKKPQLIPSSYL